MGQMRKAYKIFATKAEGTRPLSRLGRTWEDYQTGSLGNRVGRCVLDSPGSG
jgi:hypothetical protein